jgi:osmotically-inducible protein OsmY
MKVPHATDLSDAAAFAAARKCLDDCPTVPGTVRVHVVDGVVTLSGTVERPAQRAEAERIVRPVVGPRRVLNNLTVMGDAQQLDTPLNNG